MSVLTMADHAQAFTALSVLAAAHPDMPAADIHIRSDVTLAAQLTVEVRFHDQPKAFVAWLDVLRVVEPVTRRLEMGGGRYITEATQHGGGVLFVLTLHHSQRQWRPTREQVAA